MTLRMDSEAYEGSWEAERTLVLSSSYGKGFYDLSCE